MQKSDFPTHVAVLADGKSISAGTGGLRPARGNVSSPPREEDNQPTSTSVVLHPSGEGFICSV